MVSSQSAPRAGNTFVLTFARARRGDSSAELASPVMPPQSGFESRYNVFAGTMNVSAIGPRQGGQPTTEMINEDAHSLPQNNALMPDRGHHGHADNVIAESQANECPVISMSSFASEAKSHNIVSVLNETDCNTFRQMERHRHRGARRHTLVMGPSGSGKTYLSMALGSRGINAHDADTIDGLSGWRDKGGTRVRYPPNADKWFLDNHAFSWDRKVLIHFLSRHDTVYLFGISRNVFEMLDLFDNVFFLKVPPDLQVERLRDPSRTNPMGRTDCQVEYALYWARRNEKIARKLRIPMLDATGSPEQTFSQIRPQVVK